MHSLPGQITKISDNLASQLIWSPQVTAPSTDQII
jgi:hypothetical protein